MNDATPLGGLKPRIRFDWTFNFGHVLTALTVVFTGGAACIGGVYYVAKMEHRIDTAEQSIGVLGRETSSRFSMVERETAQRFNFWEERYKQDARRHEASAEAQTTQLQRLNDKFDRLLERRP